MNWRTLAPIVAIVLCGCVAKVEQPAAPSRAAANLNDPCRWLSAREATEVLGQRVMQATSPAPTYCKYAVPGGSNENTAFSIVFSVDNDVASYQTLVQRDDAAAIAGVGDRAVWNTNDNTVVVVKGNRRLILTVTDAKKASSESDLQQRAVAAAQKIAERM